MNALRLSKIWTILALLALWGLVTTPAFAFHRCCMAQSAMHTSAQQTNAAHSSPIEAAKNPNATHACCVEGKRATTQIHSGSEQISLALAATHQTTKLAFSAGGLCHCRAANAPPVTATTLPSNNLTFTALALPVQPASLQAPEPGFAHYLVSYNFAPRSSPPHSLAGRSPPFVS
jgi:hypothetical protein